MIKRRITIVLPFLLCALLVIPPVVSGSTAPLQSVNPPRYLFFDRAVVNKVFFFGRIMNKTVAIDPHYGNITSMFFRSVLCLQYYREGLRYAFVVVRYHNWRMAFQMDYYDVRGYIGNHFICAYFDYKGK